MVISSDALKTVANTGGFGTGKEFRDYLASEKAKAEKAKAENPSWPGVVTLFEDGTYVGYEAQVEGQECAVYSLQRVKNG